MHEKYLPFSTASSNNRLKCKGVWGGIRNNDMEVASGKIVGSIYSASSEGEKGGDIYYFGACRVDEITRIAIADVTGHGEAVSEISQCVYDSLKAHMWEPDSRVILGEVNQRINSRSLDAMTTAAVVAYYKKDSEAKIYYAGHPPVLFKCVKDKTWSFAQPPRRKEKGGGRPRNIPLAVDSDALYGQLTIPMISGDRLFVYTDGILDAPNPEGECFGLTRLKDVLDLNGQASLSELKHEVLDALYQFTKKGLTHDDVTMIVLEIC